MKSAAETTAIFSPLSQDDWRAWLHANHLSKTSVWLVYHKKKSNKSTLNWSEAVDHALCYGWIDSVGRKIDEETYMQFFCKRKPNSTWSKINKQKIEKLSALGLMAPAGLRCIEVARQNGSWYLLDEVEELITPADLSAAFNGHPAAAAFFSKLSRSTTKAILQWIVLAKRTETREKRIAEVVRCCADGVLPDPFSQR